MSVVDLPPGMGLVGTPLGTFRAPARARRLALGALVIVCALLVLTWYLVSQHPWRRGSSSQVVLPVAFVAFAGLAWMVRRAQVAITRDGVRWGWASLGFTNPRARIVCVHVYRDGLAFEATRGSMWFLAARDWDRFDVLLRQLRRAELPLQTHARTAPWRHRLQSYGRFLDALVGGSVLGALGVMLWAA